MMRKIVALCVPKIGLASAWTRHNCFLQQVFAIGIDLRNFYMNLYPRGYRHEVWICPYPVS